MKRLDEHNKERSKVYNTERAKRKEPVGVTCPKCEKEMYDFGCGCSTYPNGPTTKDVFCVCGHNDTMIVD